MRSYVFWPTHSLSRFKTSVQKTELPEVRTGGLQLGGLALVCALGATCLTFATPVTASAAASHTYYVSPSGNDAHDGTSPSTAWRTLEPVNSRNLADDTVLLEGGSSFAGPLNLDPHDAGVTVGSFGTGRASIVAQGTSAVNGYDVGRVTVQQLELVGDNAAFASKGGLSLYNDLPAGHRLTGVTISDLTVRGFKDGVEIGGANAGAGFAQVFISHVRAVANRDAGVITYGPAFQASAPSYANAAVHVVHTIANGNLGNAADTMHNSGSGIVLGSVDGGSILRSAARNNGSKCTAPEGPAGIWTYDSRDIRIAYSTATSNHTGGTVDGDGFDLDINVSGSSLEHNTSSGNDGAGYLVYGDSTATNRHNTVRWNTSTSDAQKNSWYGGITLAGKVRSVDVLHNRVDTSRSASGAPALAIKRGVSGATVRHNSLRSAPGHIVVAKAQ